MRSILSVAFFIVASLSQASELFTYEDAQYKIEVKSSVESVVAKQASLVLAGRSENVMVMRPENEKAFAKDPGMCRGHIVSYLSELKKGASASGVGQKMFETNSLPARWYWGQSVNKVNDIEVVFVVGLMTEASNCVMITAQSTNTNFSYKNITIRWTR